MPRAFVPPAQKIPLVLQYSDRSTAMPTPFVTRTRAPNGRSFSSGTEAARPRQRVGLHDGGPAAESAIVNVFDNGANPSIFMLNGASAHEIDVWVRRRACHL
jgi:hypothetical protein